MTKERSSNLERRKLREECRELLSNHIEAKLGNKVHPSEVRLMPKASDPYRWKPIREKEASLSDIFTKNISDHSIRAYRELRAGVDKTFEAVLPPRTITDTPDPATKLRSSEVSFSTKIEHLEIENARVFDELCHWKDKAMAESERRYFADEEVNRLYETNRQLQDRIQEYSDRANYLTGQVLKCFERLDKALPMLEELRSGLHFEEPTDQ